MRAVRQGAGINNFTADQKPAGRFGDHFSIWTIAFFLAAVLFSVSCGGDSTSTSTSNSAPTADAGTEQIADEGTEVSLRGSGTDSDGMIESYKWVQTSGKAVTLSGAGTQNASFTSPDVERKEALVFRLTVTDDEGASATDTIEITVNNSDSSKQPTPLRDPKFVFGDKLSEEDKQNFKEDAYLAMHYIRDRTDIVLNMDFTFYAFRDRENFIEAYANFYENAPGFQKADIRKMLGERGDFWATFDGPATFIYGEDLISDRTARMIAIAHEHFHGIQTAPYVGPPTWLGEGSARHVERRTLEHAGLLVPVLKAGYSKAMEMAQARKFSGSLQSLEMYEAFYAVDAKSGSDVAYSVGVLAADLLAENYGGLVALTRYYRSIKPGMTWQEGFENTFGISIEDFYKKFEAWRAESFPPE